MSFSPHLLVQRARVGTAALRSQDARVLEGEDALALALALAPPRLWGYLLDTVLDGFAEGYMRPHDGRVSSRIHMGLRVAQAGLRIRVDELLDRRAADVAMLAIARESDLVHVLASGGLSAYVLRPRGLRRLGTSDARGGVLKAEPVWCAEPVEPGDLIFAGPSSLLSEATLERVCDAGPLDAERVTSLLTNDGSTPGTAVAAFRVS